MSEQSDNLYETPGTDLVRDDGLYHFAIGPRETDFYTQYLGRRRSGALLSWHWPAFLVPSFWLLYRRMYIPFFVYVVVQNAIGMLPQLFGEAPWGATVQFVLGVLSFSVLPALYANAVYAWRLDTLVATAAEKFPNNTDLQMTWLEDRGGTSVVGVWIYLAVFILFVFAGTFSNALDVSFGL